MSPVSQKYDSFFDAVYDVVLLIPEGRVTSYGAIASYLGLAGSARMVGWAMNQAFSHPEKIPAHRVVNRNGLLTGKHHFPGENEMEKRLSEEGIAVENNQIIGFKEIFWDPNIELKLE